MAMTDVRQEPLGDEPRPKVLTRIVQSIPCYCGKCIDCEFGNGTRTVVTTVEEVIVDA